MDTNSFFFFQNVKHTYTNKSYYYSHDNLYRRMWKNPLRFKLYLTHITLTFCFLNEKVRKFRSLVRLCIINYELWIIKINFRKYLSKLIDELLHVANYELHSYDLYNTPHLKFDRDKKMISKTN